MDIASHQLGHVRRETTQREGGETMERWIRRLLEGRSTEADNNRRANPEIAC